MTDREAINILVGACVIVSVIVSGKYVRTIEKVVEALKKRIPKKPHDVETLVDGVTVGKCPCGALCSPDMKYCSECKQKLDWSDSND